MSYMGLGVPAGLDPATRARNNRKSTVKIQKNLTSDSTHDPILVTLMVD